MNNKGQVSVEWLLIATMVLSVGVFVKKQFLSGQMLAQSVDAPWSQISGMVENGVWGDPGKTHSQHPNYLHRHISVLGDKP